MQVRAIFVQPDGSKAERLLPSAPDVYRVPVNNFVPAIWEQDVPQRHLSIRYSEDRRSPYRMFDGRRVYCAKGCEAREAYLSKVYALSEDKARVLASLEQDISKFVRHTYRAAVQLDRIDFDFPWYEPKRNLGRIEVRLLVVISGGDLARQARAPQCPGGA
jgi:hypothetical protein